MEKTLLITLLPSSDYLQMPWKNKKGISAQIYLSPSHATLEKLDFDFRLSSAPIKEDTHFSKFPNFLRILLPIKGKGFHLNGAPFDLHEVAFFDGDQDTHCELIDEDVVDLGLIYNPNKITAHARVMTFKSTFFFNADPKSIYLIYILRGQLAINDLRGQQNDTFVIQNATTLSLDTSKSTSICFFKLDPT